MAISMAQRCSPTLISNKNVMQMKKKKEKGVEDERYIR